MNTNIKIKHDSISRLRLDTLYISLNILHILDMINAHINLFTYT